MQTIESTLSGCTEQPLLHPTQLAPGVFITGVGMENVWEVLRVDGEWLHMSKVLYPPATLHTDDAQHTYTVRDSTTAKECRCGYRRQAISGLLPTQETMHRVVVLAPSGPVTVPDKYTVYLLRNGEHIQPNVMWPMTLPVFPKVAAIWSVPEELRELLETAEDPR